MENALAADFAFTGNTATRDEDPRELTPFKPQYVLEAHRRFLVSHLDGLLEDDLRKVWQLTVGCDVMVHERSGRHRLEVRLMPGV
jgi:sulfite reductase (NADPH) flavoprotein alpha-component